MEGAAIVCARNFTRNSNVVTIAMDNLFFMKPILPTVRLLPAPSSVDLCLAAHARAHGQGRLLQDAYCAGRGYWDAAGCVTLNQVETTVKIIESMWNQKKQDDVSHRGYFTILNMGEYGDKEEIFVKLEVGEDELSQREYLKAKHRAEFLWPVMLVKRILRVLTSRQTHDQESCRSRPSYGHAFTQEGVVPYPPWGDEERSYYGIA
eukprot:760877-Hanusia_phi.AAC.3